MIKNYEVGNYESVDFEVNDTGADAFSIRLDRTLDFLFSDMVIYTDDERTTALTEGADWDYVTEDTYYTELESGDTGSSKTVYSEMQIINSSYQATTLYCTCNNFGAYTNGQAEGPDYQEITEDTAYTIDPQIKEAVLLIPSSVTTQLTITLTQGTHPCGNASTLNRCRVVNESSYDGQQIITDSSTIHWVEDQSAEFIFDSSGDLQWGSVGEETVFNDDTNTGNVDSTLVGNFPTIAVGQKYTIGGLNESSNYNLGIIMIGTMVTDRTNFSQETSGGGDRYNYTTVDGLFNRGISTQRIHKITLYHNGE